MSDNPFPFTELAAWAVGLHEMYAALCSAGFTSAQALLIVESMLSTMLRGGMT